MTPDRDRLLDTLGALPATAPTVEATERLRARCHAVLAQSRPNGSSISPYLNAVSIAVCAVYLAAAIYQALSFVEVIGIRH